MIYTVTLSPAVDRELTVPAIEFDTVLRASSWQVDCGGKGFNVSRMLRSLGADSMALGFAGGRSGELLRDKLTALGIGTDFVWVSGETRTNVSIVSESRNRYIKANEPGPTVSAQEQTALRRKVQVLARPGDWWVLAGSLPPGVPPTIYPLLIGDMQAVGAHAILDTSSVALLAGCEAGPFLAKPNDVELSKLTGRSVNNTADIAAAQAARALGIQQVVVSLGKRGALLANDEGVWIANSPTIEEKNPIGAGDSMVGGLVWGLSQAMSLPEALRWSLACGAATASRSGTAVGTRVMVEQLVTQVKLEPQQ